MSRWPPQKAVIGGRTLADSSGGRPKGFFNLASSEERRKGGGKQGRSPNNVSGGAVDWPRGE